MKQKGFTLVELLGVIVVLGLLAVIIYPMVNKSVNESKTELYEVQKDNIEKAAKTWGADHMYELPTEEGKFIFVTLATLEEGAYVDENLKDPKTNKNLDKNAIQVKITYKNGVLDYVLEGY